MHSRLVAASIIGLFIAMSQTGFAREPDYSQQLAAEIKAAIAAAKELPGDRQKLLLEAVEAIDQQLREDGRAQLIFICTANSRRSQLGQVWGKVAAAHYGLDVETYSGGTEASACNPRTVATLQRAGLEVATESKGDNPRYAVRYKQVEPEIELYSKRFDDDPNPQSKFIAMFCCDDADDACPMVSGAIARVRLSYADPKSADGTDGEAAAYDERSRQIAAEMFFLMGEVAKRK